MPDLIESIEDVVATLTFNRPERMNALSTPIMEGLLYGLPRLAGDPAVRVIVLTGAAAPSVPAAMSRAWPKPGSAKRGGGECTVAGADGSVPNSARAAKADNSDDQRRRGRRRTRLCTRLRPADLPVPRRGW